MKTDDKQKKKIENTHIVFYFSFIVCFLQLQ
jgi:hypothetical protein